MPTTSASVYCVLEEFRYIYFVVIVFVLDTVFMTLNLAAEVVKKLYWRTETRYDSVESKGSFCRCNLHQEKRLHSST